MKSKNRTNQDADNKEPNLDDTRRLPPTETTGLVPGSALSGMIAATNNRVLGLSPAVTITGAYLGMGLASQLGFFSNANQYQNQSMVALAAVVGAVKRNTPSSSKPQDKSLSLRSSPPTSDEPSKETLGIEDAMRLAEESMQELECC